MACLGAKNITVWIQEAELYEQELHTPKDVLVSRQGLGCHAHASLTRLGLQRDLPKSFAWFPGPSQP